MPSQHHKFVLIRQLKLTHKHRLRSPAQFKDQIMKFQFKNLYHYLYINVNIVYNIYNCSFVGC